MKNIHPNNFYNFFKDCYRLDNKEFIVDNILSSKYKYKWFVRNTEELFNDDLPYIPYPHSKVKELEKEMELYRLEKKLFYACFYVLGNSDNPLVKDKRICAPLVLFPANILSIDGLKYLEIDKRSFVINRSILLKFHFANESDSKKKFQKDFSEGIFHHTNNPLWLKGVIEKYILNLDCEELLLNPKVWNGTKLKSYFNDNGQEVDLYKIVPAAGTVLVDKSESSLRVLNDLKTIANLEEYNSSLKDLLKGNVNEGKDRFSIFQSRLNVEQFQALSNANKFNNSVIIGPPGTGKSYVITSIVADAVVNQKSVLVVSKTKQAVDVIRDMLEKDFRLHDYLIHTTEKKYKHSIKTKIQNYLSGITAKKAVDLDEGVIKVKYSNLKDSETEFLSFIEKELRLSDIDFNGGNKFVNWWRKAFVKLSMGDGEKIWTFFEDIETKNTKLDRDIKYYCRRKIQQTIKANSNVFRKDISLLYDALDASSFTENKLISVNIDFSKILMVFPIWLANLSDLNAVLPLEKDVFDLVIIDEATQCDMASALPAIYRAKHVVISGDPNQLRHYSFVSHAQQSELQKKYDLPVDKMFDYRNRSILDFYLSKITSQQQITFLREHFRSTPSLIEFSNQHFYKGQLEVLKSMPKHIEKKQIELIEVDGIRNKKGINEAEANAVIKTLDELIEKYKDQNIIPNIGIISPFSTQVTYLNKIIREKYDLKTIRMFDILCGTPYQFQGSEREIILLSFTVCNQTHHSAFIHANKPEVLNVAITRAKSYQYIFKSVSDDKLNKESLLAEYFTFIKDFSHYNQEEVQMIDYFQEEVVDKLQKRGFLNVKCGYPVGGSLLDILIENNGNHFFIDLIGYPGQFKEAFTLERYKTLGRMGIKSFPLHYSFWMDNRDKAIHRMICFLNN